MRSSEGGRSGGTAVAAGAPPIRSHEFRRLQHLLYAVSGIQLRAGKEALVRSRMAGRLHACGTRTFREYLDLVESGDGTELRELIDALATNKTEFFREAAHFDFLKSDLLPMWRRVQHPLRIWCAGCSTGEEPLSIGMLLAEEMSPDRARAARILATDVSSRSIDRARRGLYSPRSLGVLSLERRRRFFRRTQRSGRWRVRPELAAMVRFARLNLMHEWPMRGRFDLIVCRNVMIYFDAPVRQRLIERFWERTTAGGYLFVGHSESLGALSHGFRYVRPAIYVR